MVACSSNSTQKSEVSDSTEVVSGTITSIEGKWVIENVFVNDTLCVRPAEETPDTEQTMWFNNGSVGITTNCNGIGGQYILKGDSISFENLAQTEEACDNMKVEQLISKVLPGVKTIIFENDSTARLKSEGESYILLKKE